MMPEKKIVVIEVKADYQQGWNDAIMDVMKYNRMHYVKPIPIEDITFDVFQTPCWIEIRNKDARTLEFIPDVLDRDSVGYFGKLDSKKRDKTRYFFEKDYNRVWRCWSTWVSQEHSSEEKWEDEE